MWPQRESDRKYPQTSSSVTHVHPGSGLRGISSVIILLQLRWTSLWLTQFHLAWDNASECAQQQSINADVELGWLASTSLCVLPTHWGLSHDNSSKIGSSKVSQCSHGLGHQLHLPGRGDLNEPWHLHTPGSIGHHNLSWFPWWIRGSTHRRPSPL